MNCCSTSAPFVIIIMEDCGDGVGDDDLNIDIDSKGDITEGIYP